MARFIYFVIYLKFKVNEEGGGVSVSLSGAVDVSWCSLITADVGKCPVCGIAKAMQIDREAGVKLYGHCYRGECGRMQRRLGWCDCPSGPALNESTEHYALQYILDAVIA